MSSCRSSLTRCLLSVQQETYETTFEKILAAAKFMEQQGKTEEASPAPVWSIAQASMCSDLKLSR